MVEVALVDCWDGKLGPAELSRRMQVAVYCGKRDYFSPPREAAELTDFELTAGTGLTKYFLFVDNDIELGYRLSQLSKYQLTLFTTRPAAFQSLRLHIEVYADEANSTKAALVEALEEKMKLHLREITDFTLYRESSWVGILTNFAEGLVVSFRKRYEGRAELPTPEELAALAYARLASQGAFTSRQPPAPVQGTLVSIRKEGCSKFLEKLQLGINRPQKTQQVINILANFLEGGLSAARARLGQVPDAKLMARDMFLRIEDTKAVSVFLGKVTYNDEKLGELGENKALKDWVATGENDPRQTLASIEETKLVAVKIQSAAATSQDLSIGDLLSLYNRHSESRSDRKAVLTLLLTKVFDPPTGLSAFEVAASPENYSQRRLQRLATPS